MEALQVLGLVVLLALVGHLFYRAFAPAEEERPCGEVLFVQLLIGVLLCGWPALLLAELGLFSLLHLGLVLLVACTAVLVLRWQHVRRWRWPAVRVDRHTLVALVIGLAAVALLTWPGERVLGGNDPGVYLGLGASIARTGGIVLHDPLIAALPERASPFPLYSSLGELWLLPGLYASSPADGGVTPQFLHLFPTWLALFYAVGGVRALLAATSFFPLLGLAGLYFVVRHTVGRWAAPVALALFALNPAVIWFAREPMAETLALPLLMGGWYLFDRAMAEPGRRDLAAWAALALGQLALCKLELASLPFLLGLYLALRAAGRPLQANERVFLLFYPLPLAHALVHLFTVSRPYLQTFTISLQSIGIMVVTPLRLLLLAVGAALGVAMVLLLRGPLLGGMHRWLKRHASRLRQIGALAWIVLAVYAAAVRPWLSPAWVRVGGQLLAYTERLTFLRLSWYVAPIGLALGVLGLAWWISRRLNSPALPFLAAFGLEFAIYIHRALDYPYHFWMLRRYLPLILPFLTLGIAGAVQFVRRAPLSRSVRRGGVALLLGLLLWHAVQADAPWAARREMAGVLPALEGLAAQVPAGAPLFIEGFGSGLATPLRLIYGREAFALSEPARWDELWQLLGDWPPEEASSYLLLVNLPTMLHGGFAVEEVGSFALDVVQTEQTVDELPRSAVAVRSFQSLLRVQRRPTALASVEVSLVNPLWTGRCLVVDLSPPAGSLALQLEASGFRPEDVPPAQLRVSWDGTPVAEVALERSWDLRQVALTLAPPAGWTAAAGEVRLELCVETWNPQAAGYNGDARDLGILLQSLVVTDRLGGEKVDSILLARR